jgi:outer membrane receptor for ferrienterochelin and colicin
LSFRAIASAAVVFLMAAPALFAQTTTGNIAGTALVASDKSALPGVTIEAVHVPTGARYDTVTGANGRFTIPNVRVGGPYKITGSLEGFKSTTVNLNDVTLGQTAEVNLNLSMAAVSEAITVTASADAIINPNRTGSSSQVSTEQIQTLPTVNRQIQDFARTNPYVVTSLTGDGTFMFVAGRNNRYNTLQIDGAVNNDLFGLSSSGTPGGGSGTQPVSLDAIQQIQILVSPYDVRQSGFTGGGINAVTRSGTNAFEGSVFGTKRDPSYVGKGPTNTKVGEFDQTQYGGRLGGPVWKDKLFFFFSGETNKRNDPNGTSADGSAGINYTGTPAAADVANFLKTTYNYDSGPLGDLVFKTKSDLYFGRLDANIGSQHNLTLRHNYVKGQNVNTPSSFTRNTTRFYYPNNVYLFPSKTNSTVVQANSVFTQNAFNEARIGIQKIREHRETPGAIFPTIEVGGTGERSGSLQTGIERFSGANALDQDIFEFTDDFTVTKGNHNIVIGTHNEVFKFSNLFIQDFYGYYYFPTLAALQSGTPTIYRVGFATGSDPRRPTEFKAGQYSLYASDQWHMDHGVTLTAGLRFDKPHFFTTPSDNSAVSAALGRKTSAIPKEDVTFEPRIGFNWDIRQDGKQQLRGGIGVFQGRTPFVWISNNYGNTGIEQVLKGCTTAACMPKFNPDPNTQSRLDGVAGATQDIALSNPNFQFPRVLRSTLGYDRELPWGIRGSVEALYSTTQQDVFYQNINKVQVGTSPLDGRPTYANIASAFGNAYFLTNTNKGNELTETLLLSKAWGHLNVTGNYAHQRALSVGDWTSSTASSNWQFGFVNKGDIYTPVLSRTQFEIQHRFNLAATYNFVTGPVSHDIGAYYVAQSGQPYSLLMGGDPNRDGSTSNDLLFVPSNGIILCPSSASAAPTAAGACRTTAGANATPLDSALYTSFLQSVGLNPASGQILSRNILRQPWTRRLDLHYGLGLPQILRARIMIEADLLNALNMIDSKYGVERFVSNSTYSAVAFNGIDPTTGKAVYREASTTNCSAADVSGGVAGCTATTVRKLGTLTVGNQFSTANLGSRWQGRLGLRVNF